MYNNLLFIHENNIITKIESNYHNKKEVIKDFYINEYLPMKQKVLGIKFVEDNIEGFIEATNIFNNYYKKLVEFGKVNGIKSQSKWDSTFLEEISSYLFKDVPEIVSGEYGIYNKRIYAGLKINSDKRIELITKDVDFCIGKKVNVIIEKQENIDLLIPIIAVEVKTYLDATMFGEVKSSSKSIRSATPNSKTYVLMGYKSLGDEHIIAARQDSTLTEMFVLQGSEGEDFDYKTIYSYWKEVTEAISNITDEKEIIVPGRVLRI